MKIHVKRKKSLEVTQQTISLRLKAMRMIQKQGNWVPYELKPRDIERRFFACEQLFERQKRKGFLHRIVTGDEKWIHYDNPKRRKSWGKPGHASTSTAKTNIHGSKLMLCIWWGAAPAKRNHHWRSLPTAIDAFKPSIEGKTATIRAEARQSNFAARQRSTSCRTSREKILGNVEMGSPTPPAV